MRSPASRHALWGLSMNRTDNDSIMTCLAEPITRPAARPAFALTAPAARTTRPKADPERRDERGLVGDGRSLTAGCTGRLDKLRTACGLTDFELDVVLIALAPEIDRHYDRIYAYLQQEAP